MSAYLLLLALKEYLEPRLAEFPLGVHPRERDADRSAPEIMRPCRVLLGSMPPTLQEATSAAPFLLLQAMDGEDTQDGLENIRVALRFCVFADEREVAEKDLLTLISELRLWLFEIPGGVLPGGKFRLMPSGEESSRLPWSRPDEQPPPFLQGYIFSNWQTLGAVKRPNLSMIDYE